MTSVPACSPLSAPAAVVPTGLCEGGLAPSSSLHRVSTRGADSPLTPGSVMGTCRCNSSTSPSSPSSQSSRCSSSVASRSISMSTDGFSTGGVPLEHLPDGVLLYGEGGTMLEVNDALCELFGYSGGVQQLRGRNLDLLLPDSIRAAHHRYTASVFSDMRRREMAGRSQVHGRHASGLLFPVQVHLSPCVVNDVKAVWCVVRDMRQYNEALLHREAAAQHAQSAAGFLSLLNHEVRSSVHGCVVALDAVRHDMAAAVGPQAASWPLLEEAIGRMSGLLTDMVDMRNLQEGNFACPAQHFALDTLLQRLLVPYPQQRTAKGQRLLVALQPDMPELHGSVQAAVKAIAALISNASDYSSHEAAILLSFHLDRERPASLQLPQPGQMRPSPTAACDDDSDDSIGEPASPRWPRSWSRKDTQSQTERELQPPIALSRRRVLLSAITAPVTVNKSTPVRSDEPGGSGSSSPGNSAFLRCSVVDRGYGLPASMLATMAAGTFNLDVSSTRRTAAGIGFGLTMARLIAEQLHGQLTVQSWARPADGSRDSSPSDKDGGHHSFACGLGQTGCVAACLCAACETAFVQSAVTKFSFFLPVTMAGTTAGAAGGEDKSAASAIALVGTPAFQSRVVADVLSPKSVALRTSLPLLLVEDSAINVKMLTACLRKRGFANLTVARNGQEACDIVHGRIATAAATALSAVPPSDFPFSAVIMDCEMPVMDGFECTRRLKSLPGCCPVFALTADATAAVRTRCAAAGMDLFFCKPLQPDELIFALGFLSPFRHYLMQHSPHALPQPHRG